VLGEGDFVLVVSEGSISGQPTAFYDLLRIENGKIAEHWDVVETIPPESEWKNRNGKFGFER
jgi:predicted SnoaL-like aldol condensation-catalyzing enzyme